MARDIVRDSRVMSDDAASLPGVLMADIIGRYHTHTQIDTMFTRQGCRGN